MKAAALAAEFRAAGQQMNKRAGDVVIKVAADIQRDAKTLAPVDTGALRGSITHTTTRRTYDVSAEIGPEVNYGRYVEEGTSRMAAQPYMTPALERNTDQFVRAISTIVDL